MSGRRPCGMEGCRRESTLVCRFETDEGPTFVAFCHEHLDACVEVVRAVSRNLNPEQETGHVET